MKAILKILILEDSSIDAELIQRLLKKSTLQCEFNVVMDKESFETALEDFSPDVILSDNSLPQFNASEALKIVQQKSLLVPFILVTGTVSDEFAVGIIKAGADDYILKDRMIRLPIAIEAALKKRKADKELVDYKFALDEFSIVSITDANGIIKYVNENFCKVSKYTAEELIGHDHRIINSGYHPKSFFKILWDTIAEGKIFRGEVLNQAKDGELFWVDAVIVPFLNADGKPYQYLALRSDINEKKKAEEELRLSEIKLKEAQSVAHIGSWDVDVIQDIHVWSDEFYNIYGIKRAEVQPSMELFISFIHPDDTIEAQKKIREKYTTLKNEAIEFRFIRKDGKVRYAYSESRFEFDKHGKPIRIFGILQDITERKEAEEHLKQLEKKIHGQKIQEEKKVARAIIKAQESERNHLGQELHDNINQILAGAKLFLGPAGNYNEEVKELIKYPMELIDNSMQEIRSLCHKLVTPLKDIDMEVLIQSLIDKLDKTTTIKTTFNYFMPNKLLSDDLKLNIYRILQEQLNNILKHAEAKNISISIKAQATDFCVDIKDDGKGFDTEKKRKGIGISNMISRIETYNGKIEIDSSPGNGCRTHICIPY